MVKKQIDIDSYRRKKGGKIENVSSHSKMVNIKPDLSKAQKKRIEQGPSKSLINLSDMEDKDCDHCYHSIPLDTPEECRFYKAMIRDGFCIELDDTEM